MQKVDVAGPQVQATGLEPELTEAVLVERVGPGHLGVELTQPPGLSGLLDSAPEVLAVDLPGPHPAQGQLHAHHGQGAG